MTGVDHAELRVSALFLHPIKACAAIAVTEAEVQERGFAHDRRFMIVDARGDFVTQRDDPRLALLEPSIGAEDIALTSPRLAPTLAALRVPLRLETGATTRVRVWSSDVEALDAGPEASEWLGAALGRNDLRLVWMPESWRRRVHEDDPKGPVVSFADGYPYLVVSEASLAAVEAAAAGTGVAARFRPNIVLAGLGPFEEDTLEGVKIGDVSLDFVKPCSRCTVVNVDPVDAQTGKEPLASLATFRKQGGKVMFGQNAVATGAGTIAVGDLASRRRGPATLSHPGPKTARPPP